MQRCNVTVRVGGSLLNTVRLLDVSPAEIQVLQHIHGDDAVVDICSAGNDQGKQNIDEEARLVAKYKQRAFSEVFPGKRPQLPKTLKDIGIDLNADDDDKPRRGRKPKGAAAEVSAGDITGDETAAAAGDEQE
jgi:hypothetical protein